MGFQTVMSLLAAAVDWALVMFCTSCKLHQLNAHLFHTDGTHRESRSWSMVYLLKEH